MPLWISSASTGASDRMSYPQHPDVTGQCSYSRQFDRCTLSLDVAQVAAYIGGGYRPAPVGAAPLKRIPSRSIDQADGMARRCAPAFDPPLRLGNVSL